MLNSSGLFPSHLWFKLLGSLSANTLFSQFFYRIGIGTGAHKCAKKAPSGKWVEGTKPSDMPPMRRIGIDSGVKLTLCNTIDGELVLSGLDIDYYVKQAEKLVIKTPRSEGLVEFGLT